MKETVNFRDLKIKVGDTLEVTIKMPHRGRKIHGESYI